MTEQEKYIADQKASGIEVGDTVRATRHFTAHEKGCYTINGSSASSKGDFVDSDDAVGTVRHIDDESMEIDCGKDYGGGWYFPYFVLEIVKKANGTVPDAKPIDKGDSNMKTQNIYSYVVTENENVKDAKTGQIEKVKKNVLISGVVAAYDEANAKLKAMDNLSDAVGPDIDEVEVLVRPFCG